jgi:hypothetical protein
MTSSDNPTATSRLPEILLSCVAVAGLTLLLAGFVWSRILPPQAFWSQQQAEEYEDAAVTLHERSHSEEGDPAENRRQFDAARAKFEQAQRNLDAARSARDHGGRYVALLGSLLLGSGAVGLYYRRQNSARSAG